MVFSMKRILKMLLAATLAAAMAFALCVPGNAASSGQCGLKIVKKDNYNRDGKFCIPFTITGGKPYEAWSGSTFSSARLLNSGGKSVFTWSEYEIANGKTADRSYNADWSGLQSGTYTFILKLRVAGYSEGTYGVWHDYSFEWKWTYNHTQAARVDFGTAEVVMRDDGSYANKIRFKHSGAKGQTLNMAIYNEWGERVYAKSGGGPIGYNSGTYSFTWGGYPSDGGLQCDSGNYTIKWWLSGKNAKQTKIWLNIY